MRAAKLFVIFVFAMLFCASSWAQSVVNSKVTGVVTDSSGASVAGAQVQMTQTGTGLVRTATTNGDGSYTIPELPTGAYQLQVKKEGFSSYVQSGIVLQVGSNPTIDVALQIGAITQEVTVTADAAIVETHSNSIGQVVNQQEVLDIPLNGRDPMQLLTLTPAAVVSNGGLFNSQLDFPNPYVVAFAGTSPGAGTYLLDGGNDNDIETLGSFPLPFPDALQEFKADTSAVPAQYGMHSSATVNAITKSGSNQFHGDAFEFVRNALFNARSFYSPVRDPLKRNQFGGVIGGPIKKDKLFFFAAVQDTIVRDQSNSLAILPTAQELAGNFTVATAAPCVTKPVTLKAPFVGNMLPATSHYVAPSLKLTSLLPTPTDQACGDYPYQIKVHTDDEQVVGKVDYHVNDKHSLFVRYYFTGFSLPPDTTNFLTLGQVPQNDGYQDVVLGDTYLVSSSIVNSFHVNLNRASNTKGKNPDVVTPSQLGVGGNYYNPVPNFSIVNITGDFNLKGSLNIPVYFKDTDWQYADDVEVTKGAHQLAFGVEYVHFATNSVTTIYENGQFNFSGATTGLALSDFLLGDMSLFQQGNAVFQDNRKTYIGLYAQDSWQANRKITVNYGLRWEPFLPQHQPQNEANFFNIGNYIAGVHSKVFPNAPAGLTYPGDYPGNGNSYLADWTHFEPRIGVTYDPRGRGREVIRAAYGTFYDFIDFQGDQVVRQGPPWANAISLSGVNFANPYGACPAGSGLTCSAFIYNGQSGVDPYPIPTSTSFQFPTSGAFATFSELHMKAPMLQQWNLSAEKQFGSSWSITASYIGNHSTHTWLSSDENPAEWAPGATTSNAPSRRRLTLLNATQGQYFASVEVFPDTGTGTYNAGILTVQKRMSNNFSMVTNYTYGHCIDNGEHSTSNTSPAWRNDLSREIGNCAWDRRHQLTITGLVRSPQFHSGIAEAIIGHWEVAPIFGYLSGDWLSVTTGSDTALVGISGGQRANSVAGQPVYVAHTILTTGSVLGVKYFNPSAFSLPTAPAGFTGNVINNGIGPITVGPLGNLGRNILNGPSNHSFDLALTRVFKINEHNEIDARFEAFNLLNLVRFNDPSTALNSSTFGESVTTTGTNSNTPGISSPQDPRIMQFALKYVF